MDRKKIIERKGYLFRGYAFENRRNVIKHIKYIIKAQTYNIEKEQQFLMSILKCHPKYKEVLKVGVNKIFFIGDFYSVFFVQLINGTIKGVKLKRCLDNSPKTKKETCLQKINEEYLPGGTCSTHYLNVYEAEEIGLIESIICDNLIFQIIKNKKKNECIFDGENWASTTFEKIHSRKRYISEKEIEKIINKLKDNNIIKISNYSKTKKNPIIWYTFIHPYFLHKIQKSCTTPTYKEQLNDNKWQIKRKKILERDKYKCKKCGATKRELHVHHIKYWKGRMAWDYPDSMLITVCYKCHEKIHGIDKKGEEHEKNK